MIMKTTILSLVLFAFAPYSWSQTSGIVSYEEKMQIQIQMDNGNSQMMDAMPKVHTLKKVLYFTNDASLYETDKSGKVEQKMDQQEEGGPRIVIDMQVPDDKIYSDLKSNKRIELRDFMSRKFLIESDLNKSTWKFTGNQKKILGYPCQEAILQDTSKKVSVWFTPAIPVSTGPVGYGNLPGLILEASIDGGNVSIIANQVDLKTPDKDLLVKPKGGKKVTREEFNKIVEEKTKEMMGEGGPGGGNVIIKIRN